MAALASAMATNSRLPPRCGAWICTRRLAIPLSHSSISGHSGISSDTSTSGAGVTGLA